MNAYRFVYNRRLGISLPQLDMEWAEYDEDTRSEILLRWEQERGRIPDQVARMEAMIIRKQACLNEEDDFEISCRLNSEIAELASVINDLWIWHRIHQEISPVPSHH